jgi:hypothetical protein
MTRWLLGLAIALLLSFNGWGCADGYEYTVVAASVLSPDPILADATEEWAERWSLAAGADIVVGTGGIPVLAVDDVTIFSEEDVICGATLRYVDSDTGSFIRAVLIEVDVTPPRDCGALGGALGHEIGHAIGATDHSRSGIMRASLRQDGRDYVIDEASLSSVCAELPCTAFEPEAD